MERIKIDDLMNYRFLSGITAAPSGKKAALLVKKADRKKNDYDSWIAVVDFCAGEVRKLTSFGAEKNLLFEDDSTILFSSVRKPGDKAEANHERTVFYRISLEGGEAEEAFAVPYAVDSVKKLADGRFVFEATVDLNRPEDEDGLKEYQDYHILEELPYWENGAYFTSRFRRALFLFEEESGETKQVTEPLFSVDSYQASGGKIVYSGVSYSEVLPVTRGIRAYDCGTGKTEELLAQDEMRVGALACAEASCGDGLTVYFAGSRMDRFGGGQYPDLYVYRDGRVSLAAECGMAVGAVPTGDVMLGGGNRFSAVDGKLCFVACVRAAGELYALERECGTDGSLKKERGKDGGKDDSAGRALTAEGRGGVPESGCWSDCIPDKDGGYAWGCPDGVHIRKAFAFDGAIDCFCAVDGGFAMIARTPGKLQEIYYYDEKAGQCRQVGNLNGDALKDKYIGELHYAGFTDSDGVAIDGWVIFPKGYDPSADGRSGGGPAKKYPAILSMHGGPRVAFGDLFFHEMQWLAGEGYFVFLCNPRGSDGRGNAFADLRARYGTIDFKDFMEFTDHVLKEYPAIDETRVGVTGGSYGGWMTNWIIGHTGRFAAAVSQRSFSNWLSDFGCSEIGFSFDVNENGGALPWDAPMELWERSPIAHANKATTPTLFIHSLRDYNCPLSEGMQMFAALKFHGVPSKAVLFEGENHELSRSGKPLHRVRRLREMKAWFDKYLMEKEG